MAQQKIPVGIASQQIEIGAAQFATGMASSTYATDGVLDPATYGINPFTTPGALRQTAAEVNASTNVAGDIIASCEDGQAVSSYKRLLVDNAANYYTFDGTTMTKQHTGAKTYTAGTTDMISFAGVTFVTSETDMASWNTSGTPALTESWWVTTKGKLAFTASYRHPLLIFEQLAWVADGNQLYNIDTSFTIATANWTLPSNELITALGIDPQTGLMMVSVETQRNYSASLPARHYVYLYDGYSSKPRRKIAVDDMVTSFIGDAGSVIVGYGQRLGAWNGNGITFLRRLTNVTLSGADLPYKHHFARIGNILYVIDGKNILAYGEVMGITEKKWFNVWQNPVNSNNLSHIANVGSNKLGVGFAASKFYTIDMSSTSGTPTSTSVQLAPIYLPTSAYIRRIRFITTGVTGANSTALAVGLADEKGNSTFAANATRFWNVPSGSTYYVFDVNYSGAKMQGATLSFSMNGAIFGLTRIIIYFDPAAD